MKFSTRALSRIFLFLLGGLSVVGLGRWKNKARKTTKIIVSAVCWGSTVVMMAYTILQITSFSGRSRIKAG